jgi:hypothetical protein
MRTPASRTTYANRSFAELDAGRGSRRAIEVGSNFFLFFSSMHGAH